MSSQPNKFRHRRWGMAALAASGCFALSALSVPLHATPTPCAATTVATLQSCIDKSARLDDSTRLDTILVSVAPGIYQGQQIRINNRKNLWIIGDTLAIESAQPRILYQDSKHVNTDTAAGMRADTSVNNKYGQNNGTVWIYKSDNIRLMGLLVDGNNSTSTVNTSGRIFAYAAYLGKPEIVEIRGNVGVNVLMSRNVQLRYLSVTNTWNGISIISPNLGGAFAFPDPNDPVSELVATLPTSRAGLYGNHLIERCRIHDNTFGMLFQRDWDLSSVVRNNLFWGNYLRHWGDPRSPPGYITNLWTLDSSKRTDGHTRSLAYTTVGGAFLMTDVALTPYRIHNNTFYKNATIMSGYYKTGTQHLFYNNLVGRPYQFFRSAVSLNVELNAGKNGFNDAYTQTERNSEMLQYLSEHQRANRVVNQDSIPQNTAVVPDYWSASGGNFRLANMRMMRTSKNDWLNANARKWSNADNIRDSLGMTWVPDTAAAGTIADQADTGGIVRWIRHNMWTGAIADPADKPYPDDWAPPWLPIRIRKALGDPTIFRNTSSFDVRWTLGLPLDTTSLTTSAAWLTPLASHLSLKGWPGYEGTATKPLAIGAYDPAGGWAATERRLVLRDTLIESVTDSMVKFRLNISGQGIQNSEIAKLEIASAKFYKDVPVSDTLYNQGPGALPKTTTTRVNSILSSKPWVLPYQFLNSDYNRPGFQVDDSLTKNKLRADNVFLARVGAGSRLPADSLYARAEVVVKATLNDGTVIFSNPGVFMFSRPRFQFDVTVYDAITGLELPRDADGISLVAQAHQPLKVEIKARAVAKRPVPFRGYANLQMLSAGGLIGNDGKQLEKQLTGVWSVRNPNDTVSVFVDTLLPVFDTLRAMVSPSDGALKYSAVFMDFNGSLLPYFIEGRSPPIRVVSGSIFQVTIDSVFRYDTMAILTPKVSLKTAANANLGGRRDTLLVDGIETSRNLANVVKSDSLRVVLQVRDKYGNAVRDSASAGKGLYIRLAHVLAPGRYPGVATDTSILSVDSGTGSYRAVRLAFDSLGRAVATIQISKFASRSTLVALRASIIDALGRDIGSPGASRDSGIADTAWFKTDNAAITVHWVDTTGAAMKPIASGWVGEWIPVRLKMTKDLKGSIYTGSIGAVSLSPLRLHPAKGDTSTLTSAVFFGDSLSAVVWIRANDSVTAGWIKAGADSLADSVGNLRFRYPKVVSSAFFDRNCDGKIDSLAVRMDGPLAFRAPTGVLLGDSLDVVFPHQHLTPSAAGAPGRLRVIADSVLTFGWNPALMGAADFRANRITVANPLRTGKVITYSLAGIEDRAPPVAIAAFDRQTWVGGLTDSLVVTFSESVDLSAFGKGTAPPFAVVRGGALISMAAAKLSRPALVVDSGKVAFVFTGAVGLIQNGDSLVIDGTSISDLAGNLSGTTCPNLPVRIEFSPLYVPTQGYVLDVDGDGNADSVHLGFKDSLGAIPKDIVVWWGDPHETLTIGREQLIALGVKTSDSTITLATPGWKGQTIVIDGNVLYNAPRTTGPWDSAWFEGRQTREWLADRVPPVVLLARLRWGSDPTRTGRYLDTMVVDFSENVGGCAVGTDPAKCLSRNGLDNNLQFSEGSTIIDASPTRWTILMPRTVNSLKPGDSLRATPGAIGGKLLDPVYNIPGEKSPYVKIIGYPAPPNYGRMMDRDGDGRVDAVLLHYGYKPITSSLPSFDFEWGDSTGAKLALRADSSYALDSVNWIAVLVNPGAYPATGYGPAGVRPNLGTQLSDTRYFFPVTDSAAPVLKPRADLAVSSSKMGLDTVWVWPSEPLLDPKGGVLLEFRRGGVLVLPDSIQVSSAQRQSNGSWRVILGPTSAYRPSAGDQTRLSTTGSVTDTVALGNLPHPNHAWVTLVGKLRVPYAAAYQDGDKDGRIEKVSFDFASPVLAGTVLRVFDPAGSNTYREYVVAGADIGKTHIDFSFANPWGQDVTSLIKADLGWLLPPANLDSNVYKGGRFAILDQVEPVIKTAKLRYNSDTSGVDTLTLDVSERLTVDLSRFPVRYRGMSDNSDTGVVVRSDSGYAVVYDSLKGTMTIYLKPFPTGYSNPASGDSLRLSWLSVADALGNAPQQRAKWVVVNANTRVFPPSIHVTTYTIDPPGKAGTMVDGPQFDLVGRASTPDGTALWKVKDPTSSGWIQGNSTYTPNRPGAGGVDLSGTVIYIQTNVPTTIKLYIYDNMGVFVGQLSRDISKEIIDELSNDLKSTTGMVDVGFKWKGQRADGRLVSSGIYPVRLMAIREPVADEKAQGKVNNFIYNRLMRLGVRLPL